MIKPLALAALLLAAAPASAAKIGLSSRFVDESAGALEAGRTHKLRRLKLPLYIIVNIGETPLELTLAAERPRPGATRSSHEPIPDAGWLRFLPDRLAIAAGDAAESELELDIPDDPRLYGRSFEVHLWARTGERVAAGVRSRLRFTVRRPDEPAPGKK